MITIPYLQAHGSVKLPSCPSEFSENLANHIIDHKIMSIYVKHGSSHSLTTVEGINPWNKFIISIFYMYWDSFPQTTIILNRNEAAEVEQKMILPEG